MRERTILAILSQQFDQRFNLVGIAIERTGAEAFIRATPLRLNTATPQLSAALYTLRRTTSSQLHRQRLTE